MWVILAFLPSVLLVVGAALYLWMLLSCKIGLAVGIYLRRRSYDRKEAILDRVKGENSVYKDKERESPKSDDDDWEKVEEQVAGSATPRRKADDEWNGIIGFFHPFCNAGGGGERVLWAAIKATQTRWPKAICIVYTGDHDASKRTILERVEQRFNIHLHPPTVVFLYLQTRHYVLATTWPHFTLLGQSFGSLILGYDAFQLLVPDVLIDTMGYAFTLALSKFFFPNIPTGAYVHYPTISTDMLSSLDSKAEQGLNAGAGNGLKGIAKRKYWHLFAWLYSQVGRNIDMVLTNSSWTQGHIRALWGPNRAKRHEASPIQVLFPPVAAEEVEKAIELSPSSEQQRQKILLYIAQFRPEKNHALILRAFAEMLHSKQTTEATKSAKLVLIGSVRDSDDSTRVYDLRLLAHELKIKDSVEFNLNASWDEILNWLRKSWVGVNGMWNEHFGIGVVEYQAAGLISVVNASGGPKQDIVVEYEGGPTGFHASTVEEYAARFRDALDMSPEDTLAMRLRARASARRFTEEAFARQWVERMERLVAMASTAVS